MSIHTVIAGLWLASSLGAAGAPTPNLEPPGFILRVCILLLSSMLFVRTFLKAMESRDDR